jgi:hypothetical protein
MHLGTTATPAFPARPPIPMPSMTRTNPSCRSSMPPAWVVFVRKAAYARKEAFVREQAYAKTVNAMNGAFAAADCDHILLANAKLHAAKELSVSRGRSHLDNNRNTRVPSILDKNSIIP